MILFNAILLLFALFLPVSVIRADPPPEEAPRVLAFLRSHADAGVSDHQEAWVELNGSLSTSASEGYSNASTTLYASDGIGGASLESRVQFPGGMRGGGQSIASFYLRYFLRTDLLPAKVRGSFSNSAYSRYTAHPVNGYDC